MFIDETGFLLQPLVRRTWARRGQTPLLRERRRHHRRLSAIGALTIAPRRRRLNLYLQFHPDRSVRQEQVIEFLKHLRRHVRGPIQIIWDRLNAHRGALVRQYFDQHPDLRAALLPPYAPELNPIETGWAYLKTNPLANLCPADVAELHQKAARAAAAVRRQPRLLRGFLRNAALPIRILHAHA